MDFTIETQKGKIKITYEVIADLAGKAASECFGLAGMASQKVRNGFAGLLGKEVFRKGVKVSKTEEKIVLDIDIIVNYGMQISVVAEEVMQNVKSTVEGMTGIEIKKININVRGVKV